MRALAFCLALLIPASVASVPTDVFPMPDPGPVAMDGAAAMGVLGLVNDARNVQHLQPLVRSRSLAQVALAHIRAMLRARAVAHVLPGESFLDRFTHAVPPGTEVGEVIAVARTATDAASALLASPEHRAILLDPRMTTIGVAAARCAWGLVVEGDLAGTPR